MHRILIQSRIEVAIFADDVKRLLVGHVFKRIVQLIASPIDLFLPGGFPIAIRIVAAEKTSGVVSMISDREDA